MGQLNFKIEDIALSDEMILNSKPEESEEIKDKGIKSRIKQLIKESGLKQYQFADKVGMSQSAFSQVLNVKGREVNQVLLNAISLITGCDPLWLKYGDNQPPVSNEVKLKSVANRLKSLECVLEDSLNEVKSIIESIG